LDVREPFEIFAGKRIGAYEIVTEIGVGGMGEGLFGFSPSMSTRKKVAIKVVRGGQDSGFVVSRFKNERQIRLASIIPILLVLLDGRTTEKANPPLRLIDRFPHISRDRGRQLFVVCRHDSQMITRHGFYFELSCQASPNSTWIGGKVGECLSPDGIGSSQD